MEKGRKRSRGLRAKRHTGHALGTAAAVRVFTEVVEAVQERWVLPHCRGCVRPCCTLETLVLEFSWRQLRLLWGIRKSRQEFDARLAQGKGPVEVRTQDGMYYVHKKACPAYRDGLCSVYGSDLKPSGCSDFPLCLDDGGGLLADLRCEALSMDRVESELRARLPPNASLRRHRHPEFPFLVTFRVGPRNQARGPRPGRVRKRRP